MQIREISKDISNFTSGRLDTDNFLRLPGPRLDELQGCSEGSAALFSRSQYLNIRSR